MCFWKTLAFIHSFRSIPMPNNRTLEWIHAVAGSSANFTVVAVLLSFHLHVNGWKEYYKKISMNERCVGLYFCLTSNVGGDSSDEQYNKFLLLLVSINFEYIQLSYCRPAVLTMKFADHRWTAVNKKRLFSRTSVWHNSKGTTTIIIKLLLLLYYYRCSSTRN